MCFFSVSKFIMHLIYSLQIYNKLKVEIKKLRRNLNYPPAIRKTQISNIKNNWIQIFFNKKKNKLYKIKNHLFGILFAFLGLPFFLTTLIYLLACSYSAWSSCTWFPLATANDFLMLFLTCYSFSWSCLLMKWIVLDYAANSLFYACSISFALMLRSSSRTATTSRT